MVRLEIRNLATLPVVARTVGLTPPRRRNPVCLAPSPIAAAALARRFAQGRRAERKVNDVLHTLTLLGQAGRANGGYILSARPLMKTIDYLPCPPAPKSDVVATGEMIEPS